LSLLSFASWPESFNGLALSEAINGVFVLPTLRPSMRPAVAGTSVWPHFRRLLSVASLASVGERVLVIQGAIFVACALLFCRGIIGELAHKLRTRGL